MKKEYIAPELKMKQIPDDMIICESIPYDGNGNGRPAGAKGFSDFEDMDSDMEYDL
jgi:hypothetical protein